VIGKKFENINSASVSFPSVTHKTKYAVRVQLRYNYRLDPATGQRAALGKAFGCARVVFNDGLAARQEAHEAGLPYLTDAELSAWLTAAKATPERAWLGEVSAVVLQQAQLQGRVEVNTSGQPLS
jgi:Helix-turn-helix domain